MNVMIHQRPLPNQRHLNMERLQALEAPVEYLTAVTQVGHLVPKDRTSKQSDCR
jgi:hypothetical protein